MTEVAAKLNPQEALSKNAKEASLPVGLVFSWEGSPRVPERLTIIDPNDPEGKKLLWDVQVGYMRDGMIYKKDTSGILGTYERISDNERQEDGTVLNSIMFHPTDEQLFFDLLKKTS